MDFARSALITVSLGLFSFTSYAANQELPHVRLATTTSTYHSGLLNHLLPEFEKDTGYKVDVIAAGTGKSLRMGENGDVDLVMTHAPKAEATFVSLGYGVQPRKLMYNDFVIVGPKDDPANIVGENTVLTAFEKIAQKNATFISRGDDSGTHKKEMGLWEQSKIDPNFGGYRSVGQGMGPTLNMAAEMQGYTMTDRGTWLAYNNKLDLTLLFQGDKKLFNPYQVILVNPERYPSINYQGAKVLSDWLVAEKGQALINQFKLNGKQLFVSNAAE
ncbi:substrate-binding domain-containing protein [Vibrio genomosp. F10]|uniref:Tungsten ABC transporter substrate-binding protein n=1 Tax=Vibrio genomosp. F10 str. ZF-129 TaxID=1187848 RepID=A0A1E5BFQ8_9VIBR|nr:substrate-binding domain-containing protein [Vibrio genomosp. F10]OEE34570.1 tungsten ABC transporter substrate-binding protein [Vibrio genomosp. F10 str. ZF-129]OEE93815.1 tungsten ABC transporter substrate-binding protein [Vibrio genomosp. F10 str. 9ZC157]OEF05620.1 tungsten ABC transporter substrate-binding protein [Vibrio genomosp. F10 str. 9ZB36]OEF12712.1 tungsten ABC transporter substrate-binding protein [Vibrio genomosp. F10 str. 9ZD137]